MWSDRRKAQALSLALAKKIFPGYQALVVTHTDGHNNSGNIHTHIVINSVRKYTAERSPICHSPTIMKLDISIEPPINSPNISKGNYGYVPRTWIAPDRPALPG